MDRFEPNLRIPGPTALPPSVREAGGRQMINHRGPEFAAMLGRILSGMQPYFGTTGDIAMITTAGHRRARGGGRQHAVARRPRPGRLDRFVRRPVRQDRRDLRRGRDQARCGVGLGRGPADEIRETLRGDADVKAVLLTHNETSTGVMNPIPELAAAVREEAPDALILVDSVSRPGCRAVRDGRLGRRRRRDRLAEGLDGGAGLAMIAASPRAWAAMETRDDAALLPRPARPSRAARQRPDAVDAGHRGRLPGGRGHPADGRGGRARRSSPATRRAPRRRGPASARSASSSSPTRRSPRRP